MKVQVEYLTQHRAMMELILGYNQVNPKTPFSMFALAIANYYHWKWNDTGKNGTGWDKLVTTSKSVRIEEGLYMNDDTFYGCMKKLESIGVLKYDYRANPKRYSTVEMTILAHYTTVFNL